MPFPDELARDLAVVAYDRRWPGEFAVLADKIYGAVGPVVVRVDHVGSTSVPGLAAKDCIDVQVDRSAEVYKTVTVLLTQQTLMGQQVIDFTLLERTDNETYCPYKGDASYYSVLPAGADGVNAVWTYEQPYDAVADIRDHVAFYPNKVSIEIITD